VAVILIYEAIRGGESFRCSCKTFDASASAFRRQYMLHKAIK
jgi:hypothetical protein